jgi:hypothetical protein
MLGFRDLEGRALDHHGQVFAGDSTDLDAKALGRRVEEPKQAALCTVVDVGPRLSGHLFTLVHIQATSWGMERWSS